VCCPYAFCQYIQIEKGGIAVFDTIAVWCGARVRHAWFRAFTKVLFYSRNTWSTYEEIMKTWLKRILIGLVVVVVAAVVGLAIFLLTFDPNAYKYKLEEIIQARYHRTLTVGGEIQLSLFPRIGLALQDVSLSEPDSAEKFASIQSARLAVQVWPLLSNNLVVDNVAIVGFKARVVRRADGRFNFANLVGRDRQPVVSPPTGASVAAAPAALLGESPADALAAPPVSSSSSTRFHIDIAGLDLKNGEILLQDNVTNKAVALTKLNASTGRVTFNQPFNFTMSGHLAGGDPRMDAGITGQVMLTLDPSAHRYAAQDMDLRLKGQLPDAKAQSLSARGNLAYDGNTGAVNVSALEVVFQGDVTRPDLPMTGVDASIAMPKLSIDPFKNHLQIDRLAIRAKGGTKSGPFEFALDTPSLKVTRKNASGDALTARLRLDGPKSLDASFGFTGISGNAGELEIKQSKFNATTIEGARQVKVSLNSPLLLNLSQRAASMSALRGVFTITDPALPQGNLQIPVIGSMSADLVRDVASATIGAVLESGKFDLTADVTHLTQKPAVGFTLAVDTLDLDKLAPPLAALQARPAATGTLKAAATPAAAPSDDNFDFSALIGPSANGTIQIGHLIFRGLKADDVASNLTLDKGKLSLNTLTASLYDGKLAGVLSLDASQNNKLATKLSLAGVSIEPLLTDVSGSAALSGRGSIVVDLTTAGSNSYALKNALDGSVQLRLRDGAVHGFDVAQTLRDLKTVVEKNQLGAARQALTGAVTAANLSSTPEAAVQAARAASAVQAPNPGAAPPSFGASVAAVLGNAAQAAEAAISRTPAAGAATGSAAQAAISPPPAPTTKAPAAPAVAATGVAAATAPATAAVAVSSAPAASPVVPAASTTDFTSLDLAVAFNDGVGTIKSLALASPLLRITQGKPATFNLVSKSLDIMTLIRVLNPASQPLGVDLQELKNVTVPLHVVGPFDAPVYSIQWRGALQDAAKQALQKNVIDAVDASHSKQVRDIGGIVRDLLKKK
jgi:AsmA protein